MKEHVENLKEYVKNMEYEEICQYIGFGTPTSIWVLEKFRAPPSYSLCDLEKFRILPLYMGFGTVKIPRLSFLLGSETWKNFMLCLYIGLYRFWDLEKF